LSCCLGISALCHSPHRRHHPRRRVIQYAAAFRFNHRRLWNTGSPTVQNRHFERSEAIRSFFVRWHGLPRGACRWARIRPTRWLAMTADTVSRSRDARRPRFARYSSRSIEKRAQGMPDARCTRGLMCNGRKSAHMSIQGSGGNPTFPAQGRVRTINT
jgi:hypothetical protein